MKLRIEHALIVTMNDRDQVIEDGAMVINGNRLEYVGPADGCPRQDGDRVIDGSRFIAIPGTRSTPTTIRPPTSSAA